MNNRIIFIMSILSGLSTLLGYFSIYIKNNREKIICYSLAFSSGVMLSISIFDLSIESIKLLNSFLLFILFFILSFLITFLLNKNINNENSLYKVGFITMIGLILHNIPEGILTYASYSINSKLGISITTSIIMHNIPEGISIAIPIYYSTNSKYTALFYTLISSLAEPLGTVLSFIFIKRFINNYSIGILFSLVSGIMVYISIFELLKESKKYKYNNKLAFLIGFLFVLISLIL